MIFSKSLAARCVSIASMLMFVVVLPARAQTQGTTSLPDNSSIAWIGAAPSTVIGATTAPDGSQAAQSSSSNPQNVAQPALEPNQKTTVVGAPLPASNGRKQPKRILGVIPNFRSVSAGTKLPPQSVKEKFVTATQDTFDYSALTFSALVATEGYAANSTPEFGSGGVGFGRYMWHTYVDQSIENSFVEFIVPATLHEDTRYYTLGHGGFVKRVGYSLGHVLVTRDDAGKNVFNAGEVVGAGIAAGISNAYYPSPERTYSNTAQKWGVNVGLDALTFAFKEFWPDLDHKVFHDK
jgi:hypothetical protein